MLFANALESFFQQVFILLAIVGAVFWVGLALLVRAVRPRSRPTVTIDDEPDDEGEEGQIGTEAPKPIISPAAMVAAKAAGFGVKFLAGRFLKQRYGK